MRKFENAHKWLIHGYMLCSLIATGCLFVLAGVARAFYTVGASSGYIALGIFSAGEVGRVAGLGALAWGVLFPIALIVTYILAIKKHYVPFYICVFLDTVAVAGWLAYALAVNNMAGVSVFVIDAIVSVVYTALILWMGRKRLQTMDNGEGPRKSPQANASRYPSVS